MPESAGKGLCVHQESSTDKREIFLWLSMPCHGQSPEKRQVWFLGRTITSFHRNMRVHTCTRLQTHTHTLSPTNNSCYSRCAPRTSSISSIWLQRHTYCVRLHMNEDPLLFVCASKFEKNGSKPVASNFGCTLESLRDFNVQPILRTVNLK